jgi:hypothetical protein
MCIIRNIIKSFIPKKIKNFVKTIFDKKSVDRLIIVDKFNSAQPISRKFGFDRGMPIDRYYIDASLRKIARIYKAGCWRLRKAPTQDAWGQM